MLSLVAGCALLALAPAVPLPEEIENVALQRRAAAGGRLALVARLREIEAAFNKEKEPSEFQGKICEAALLLLDADQKTPSRQFTAPDLSNQQQANAFKIQLSQIQMNLALIMFKLDSMTEELGNVKGDRSKQSKTWQAHYDYVAAHTLAQMAFLYEYNFQLGQMRKEFPALDPSKHEGWELIAAGTIRDRDAAAFAKKAKVHLERLIQSQPGTAWEKAGKADLATVEAGLQWEPYLRK